MRAPSAPLDTFETRALARWGLEVHAGRRGLLERLLEKLERAITAQPADEHDRFRIVQLKEKFGGLTVYLATKGTPEMKRDSRRARRVRHYLRRLLSTWSARGARSRWVVVDQVPGA
jgi:hypothetical protein